MPSSSSGSLPTGPSDRDASGRLLPGTRSQLGAGAVIPGPGRITGHTLTGIGAAAEASGRRVPDPQPDRPDRRPNWRGTTPQWPAGVPGAWQYRAEGPLPDTWAAARVDVRT